MEFSFSFGNAFEAFGAESLIQMRAKKHYKLSLQGHISINDGWKIIQGYIEAQDRELPVGDLVFTPSCIQPYEKMLNIACAYYKQKLGE